MSFILDALKKSEAERQNQAGAGISNTPRARQQNGLPGWAMGLIAVLGLAVVALGWAWWQAERSRVPLSTVVAPPPVAAPAGGPVRDLAAEARPTQSVDPPPVTRAQTTPATAAQATGPASNPPISVAQAPLARPTSVTLPTAGDLAVQGIALPEMNLDIHVYSSNKAERFVFINSAKYREGERLPDGPRIDEITADGVTLSYQGVSFVLPRD